MLNEDSLECLEIFANILQVANYIKNTQQTSNDEIMKALELQNKKYLEITVEQNKEIIKRLERLEKCIN